MSFSHPLLSDRVVETAVPTTPGDSTGKMSLRKLFFLLVVGFSVLPACSSNRPVTSSAAYTVLDNAALPPPSRGAAESSRPYLIGPFDKLKIAVFGIEDLTQEVQADASGRISVPLAGVIEASGKTPFELAEVIRERLQGRYVRNPQVTVNLVETVSQVITVDGEVKEPGLYPVIGKMTLMRAVATAKGSSEFADLEQVVIFRKVGDREMAGIYDLRQIRRGAYADPEVYADDVVIVGSSQVRRLFKDALNIVPLITTPLTLILTR